MPKSKHAKGRRTQNYKSRQPRTAPVSQSASTTAPAAAVMVKPAPAPKTPGYKPATTEQYPYFVNELKRISILTAVLVVVLIILALVIN